MLKAVLVLGKDFIFLSRSSPCCLLAPPCCAMMGNREAETQTVGTVHLCHPHAASSHKWAHRPGSWGFHYHGKSFSPSFSKESVKKEHNSHKMLVSNGQLPHTKNYNHKFNPISVAKDAAHVAAGCYKNRYFYHLRTNLCYQILKSSTTPRQLLTCWRAALQHFWEAENGT